MISQGIFFIILTFAAKVTGFFRDLVVSYYYGASNMVDAYVIATTIPMVVFSFLGTGIQTSFIPMMTRIKKEKSDIGYFISNMTNIFTLFCVVAILIVLIFTEPIINLFASGFDSETMGLAVSFTRFSIIGIVFSTLTYIYTSVLQLDNHFIAPAISTILMDGTVLLFVVLSHYFGIIFLPIGNVVALVVQALFIRVFVRYKHRWIIDIKNKYFYYTLKEIMPTTIGTSVSQINKLVDQSIASYLMVGAISYLNYANKVLGVVQGVFILTFITYFFPDIARILKNNTREELTKYILQKIQLIEFFIVPCTVLFCLYAKQIIELLFFRGNFGQTDVYYTAIVLFFYSLELPFYALKELISRIFFADGNTKIPMVNSVLSLVINAGLNIVLAKYIGLAGLPIATTASCVVTTIFIMRRYLKDYCRKEAMGNVISIIKYIIAFLAIVLLSNVVATKILGSLALSGFKYKFIVEIILTGMIYVAIVGVFLLISKKLKKSGRKSI